MFVIACSCEAGDWVGVVSDGSTGVLGVVRGGVDVGSNSDASGVGVDGSIGDAIALMVLMVLVTRRLS